MPDKQIPIAELKPCPFCGYEIAFVNRGQLYFWGECTRCCAQSCAQTTQEKAANAWNTRAEDPRISSLAHQLSQEKERLKGGPTQPCGHSIIWEIRSAETFEVLYCDICNMRSELRDALQMEAHYKAENTRLTEALRVKEEECARLGKQLGEMRQLLLKGASPHAYGSHVSPDVESCALNRQKEPEGERLRAELEAWLEANKIVSVMMDTRSNFVNIDFGPHLPPRIRPVLTHWGSIYIVDPYESDSHALLAARRTQEREEHGG